MARKSLEEHAVSFGRNAESEEVKEFLDSIPKNLGWNVDYLTKMVISVTHGNPDGSRAFSKNPYNEFEGIMTPQDQKHSLHFRTLSEGFGKNLFKGLRFYSPDGYGLEGTMRGQISEMKEVREYAEKYFKKGKWKLFKPFFITSYNLLTEKCSI